MHKMRFKIECGETRRTIEAESPQDAWRDFKNAARGELGELVRFKEVPWNSEYRWDNRQGGHYKRGQWYYCHPCWFDGPPAASFTLSSLTKPEPTNG